MALVVEVNQGGVRGAAVKGAILWEIGKSEEWWCVCDGWAPQNAAHLMECPWVGDGRGRRSEMLWEDEKWCEAVADFVV